MTENKENHPLQDDMDWAFAYQTTFDNVFLALSTYLNETNQPDSAIKLFQVYHKIDDKLRHKGEILTVSQILELLK